ncbi:TetM/TetW/TetO/TetS family tetracycline resistance ribosomal protection protein [Amycolatopsis sp. PS_44_ISF1]|uniref:TetM/TetW/TetO/TetS family tetracycline resistance ribosomal protection protein n=1 Tax=Amycolatopsis sp. PS_44_ISF1 TaxID=2974917 RepID=UPI0028DEEF61|nr:TetM/TetW/TetO/TetS family tetracycline resistance ribosomal protection protein [Amycolatopsis sp. PS_44_ISF1]MDT8909474.1 TetM/TetW/TetO/TetS family tetracycline resistance ribosomal protection protein [Amycolatopsis sp. PS_44_ISF1]
MQNLTIGILAHVDAGKTSLTERLLFAAGVIGHLGSVDGGDTQTDSLELERRRGITISSAVVAFTAGGRRVTLVDTPGHSDFIAEVERALRVLDGAVLVVSAVEGVQAQTRVLMRTLTRLGLPVLVFVNKIDRMGAQEGPLLDALRAKLSPRCVALSTVSGLGTARAEPSPLPFGEGLADALADDNRFLAAYVAGQVSEKDYRDALARQVAAGAVHPVLFGSAITGAGVGELVTAVRELFPARAREGTGPLDATVFKIERGRAGEKIAYTRVRSGSLAPRQRFPFYRRENDGTVTELTARASAVRVYEHGAVPVEGSALAGDVARVWGLKDVRIGDQLGSPEHLPARGFFAPPSLEAVVRPVDPDRGAALSAALDRLSEQDPFIGLRRRGAEVSVRLYGEVQKEVVGSTLAEEFGVPARFEPSRTLYVERLTGPGSAVRAPAPDERVYFWATVGLRVEPAAPGSGVGYALAVELGSLPLAFHKAIEETVHEALRHGPRGWEVIDCLVTLTHTRFYPPVSTAGDFREMTKLVLREALRRAGTRVHEPVNAFEAEVPTASVSAVLRKLVELRAVPDEPTVHGPAATVAGTVPAASVPELEQALPALTQGEGVFFSQFAEYRPR